ncbi:MAG TPA: CGNR zinc finger domain-containing protein [Streptosporangiaceae bacterium]|nr:CGNR zinc finger domain-containing protein [Streptosporangiaceae bacterium]
MAFIHIPDSCRAGQAAARWCSMAVCGNRMKARRHYQRGREQMGSVQG